MTDFETLKEIFEMTEILEDEGDGYLEISAYDARTNNNGLVTFIFNEDGELKAEVSIQE